MPSKIVGLKRADQYHCGFCGFMLPTLCFLILSNGTGAKAAEVKHTPLPPAPVGKPCLPCKQSENQLLQTLKQQEKSEGPNSLMVAFTLDELAKVHLMQRRLDDARKALFKALEIERKHLPAEDNQVAYTLGLIASTYHAEADNKNYKKYADQAMTIFQNNLKQGRPMQLEALDSLAHIYVMNRDIEKAIPTYERALTVAQERGEKPMGLAARYETLGMLYRRPETTDKAMSYFQKAIDLRKNNPAKSDAGWSQLLWDKQMIGSLLIMKQNYAAAGDLFVGTAKTLTDKKAKNFWHQTLVNYAQVLDRSNQPAQAKRLTDAAKSL